MSDLGFTGTRKGMSDFQKEKVRDIVKSGEYTVFHHGDCVGSDEEFHRIVLSEIMPDLEDTNIIIYPPDNDKYRAFCEEGNILEPKPYLDRNRDIAGACNTLLVAPDPLMNLNTPRSGTWCTARVAKSLNKHIIIII